ncbi:MAG: hypothetical protein F4118_11120 [Acidimicrobiaceae bacterium]|nr:hypothetical protein [Acidimicrobiaceae bacterium]
MVADAIELYRQPVAGIGEVDLGYERSIGSADPIFESGPAESDVNKEILNHPAPFAQRDRVVAQASVEGGAQGSTTIPPPTRV